MVVVGIMLTAAVVLGVLQLVKGKNDAPPVVAATTNAAPAADAPSDDATLVARVATLISVNPNETPTIATVQDPETLKSQNASFYKEVEVGDRLLLWSDKAVLFSVKRNVVLNAIMISTAPSVKEAAASVTEKAVIEVRNGSGVAGIGKSAATLLSSAGLTVLTAKDADHKDYQTTVIYVSSGKSFPTTVKKIQATLGVSAAVVTSTSETQVSGDILVVTGLDLHR